MVIHMQESCKPVKKKVHAQSANFSRGTAKKKKKKAQTKRLLLQNKEDGVKELEIFEKVVDDVVKL